MNETILKPLTEVDSSNDVMRLEDVDFASVSNLLGTYGLALKMVASGHDIPGSFWGDEEAGLIGSNLLVRDDTPLHSVLHEACHYVCLDEARRSGLHTDAGGDYDEENAVCYLQIILADHIKGFGQQRMFQDMDSWGYTFRLGSAQTWFEKDADDALHWLLQRHLVDRQQKPCWTLRKD